jgi:hypothetical protein
VRERRAGRDALALCIHRPDEAAIWFRADLFTDPVQRSAFLALVAASSLHEAIAQAEPDATELLSRLAVADAVDEIDLQGTLMELVRAGATRAIRDLDNEIRRIDPVTGAVELKDRVATSVWAKGELELLRDPIMTQDRATPATEAVERLLAWLCPPEPEAQ